MGVVYRAVDDDLGRVVALKFIPPHLAGDAAVEQRFLREARAASALDHVNAGAIYGVEEAADGRRFIVMAYYEGENLASRIADLSRPLPPEEAAGIAVQVARGLAEAHARGVIHRDIKPSNILLTPNGIVKIVDFGLASMQSAGPVTESGVPLGTPAYMSPEQALGQPAGPRSDIWALGVVLCEMLTRRRAFQAESIPAILFNVVHGELPDLDSIPPPVRAVVERALARDPEQRFQTMAEFLAALEALAGLGPAAALTAPALPRAPRTLPFTRRRLAAVLLALVILAGAAATLWLNRGRLFRPPIAGAAVDAGAYDKYLAATDLIKRWDKPENLDLAGRLLEETIRLDPNFALAYARLAEVHRIRFALTRDKALLDLALKQAGEALRLGAELAPVQVAAGRVHALRGNNDLAMASFERALRIDANDPEAHQAIARQYERLGRLQDAQASFERAVSLDPGNIAAHDAYANFLFRQSRYPEAIRHWQDVIRLAPGNAPALVNLGSALSESGRVAEAVVIYRRAVELNPSAMAFTNLGTAYSRARRYPDAVAAYRRAVELDRQDYLAWGNLAFVLSWMEGSADQAREAFDTAIRLAEARRKESPRDAFLHSDLALYYAKTARPSLALERLRTALALAPKGPEIQAAAAEVHEILRRRPAAIDFARKALQLGYPMQRLQRNPELAGVLKALSP
jgi:tetratricopeptide (TPR) repeat protein